MLVDTWRQTGYFHIAYGIIKQDAWILCDSVSQINNVTLFVLNFDILFFLISSVLSVDQSSTPPPPLLPLLSDTYHHMIVSVSPPFTPCDLWQRAFHSRECDNPTAAQQKRGRWGREGGRAQQKGLRQLKRVMQQQYGRLHRRPTAILLQVMHSTLNRVHVVRFFMFSVRCCAVCWYSK